MALNFQPNLIGGGDPNKVLFSTSNDIMSQQTGAPPLGATSATNAPLTPPAPVQPMAQAPSATAPTPLASPSTSYRNKYDDIFDEAQSKLENLLNQKDAFSPIGLAMSRGFFKPTKTGSFSESLGNVAEEVGNAQSQMQKNDITNVQARMALAKAASERENEKSSQDLLGKLYSNQSGTLKIDPQVAQRLTAITKDPRFIQQAVAEQQTEAKKAIGQNMFKQRVVPGKDGAPDQTVIDFNPNSVYDLMKISQDPIKDLGEYAKLIPELRKSGLISGLQEEGTPFDALVLMAPTSAVKQQAQYLAKQYASGKIDPDKALTMANSMMTMAQAHMDKQEQMRFQQGIQGMMLSMKQDSLQMARDKFAEQQKENDKKLSDEQKILYRQSVIPIINEGVKASEAITSLGQIKKVVETAPSGAIKGGLAKSVGALFGTDDNTALRDLEALSKSLVTKIPRLPGSQSNMDAKNLEKSIGSLYDPTLTNSQRLAIINEVEAGFRSLQERSDQVQDYWDSNKKLPKWTTETANTNTRVTPTPAPTTSAPVVDFSALPTRRP